MKPVIGITMGDPAGIGPEIIIKSLIKDAVMIYEKLSPVVIGDSRVLENALMTTGLSGKLRPITSVAEAKSEAGVIDVLDLKNISPADYKIGKVSGKCGRASFEYIKKAVNLGLNGELKAVSTGPINKIALKEGGVKYIGHTEILSDLCGSSYDPLTIFEVKGLRVFFLTRHVSLKKACELVTAERVYEYIIRCTETLVEMGIEGGALAVAGLNPHSGEGGLFGDEEVKEIIPAVEKAKQEGYNVEGPISADSVFHQALQGKYAGVLALYHDQGHIATKTLDFERTISITSGLPFLRVSVDHGTAFDIAGQNKASHVSMTESLLVAGKYV